MPIELRLAEPRELRSLQPLVRAYHAFEHIERSDEARAEAITRLLANPLLGGIWLIFVEDLLAGYIALCKGFSIEFGGFDAFIDEFYLEPEFRGQGVGRQVLAAIKPEARRLQIKALHLEVARDNLPARKLYAKSGFEGREKYLLMTAEIES